VRAGAPHRSPRAATQPGARGPHDSSLPPRPTCRVARQALALDAAAPLGSHDAWGHGCHGPHGSPRRGGLRGGAVRVGEGWREGQRGIAARLLHASSTFHDTRVRWCAGPGNRWAWAGCRVVCGLELACGASGGRPTSKQATHVQ
jgi:hypothetical protein